MNSLTSFLEPRHPTDRFLWMHQEGGVGLSLTSGPGSTWSFSCSSWVQMAWVTVLMILLHIKSDTQVPGVGSLPLELSLLPHNSPPDIGSSRGSRIRPCPPGSRASPAVCQPSLLPGQECSWPWWAPRPSPLPRPAASPRLALSFAWL